MNTPGEGAFIHLQNETLINIAKNKDAAIANRKTFHVFYQKSVEMAQLVDCVTCKIFYIGKPFTG